MSPTTSIVSTDRPGSDRSWRRLVALRLLGSRSNHRLLSFIGLLSIGGLALAVAVLVTVLSVVNGFDRELRERVLGVLPHGTLYARQAAPDWTALQARLAQHPGVTGVAPVVEGAGLALANGRLEGVSFRGVDVAQEPAVSILPGFMQAGRFEDLGAQRFGVLLGAELADELGVTVGDNVNLVLPRVSFSLAGPVLTTRKLHVTGIFRVGADMDRDHVLLNINDARRLKRQSGIDGLVIRTDNLFEAPRILHEFMLTVDEPVYGVSWMRRSGNLYEAIGTQKATLFLLLMILVSVAAFNVVSNLVMTVDDHRSGIAILRTMGATKSDMRWVFVMHGLLVGCIGLVTGLVAGLLLTLSLGQLFGFVNDVLNLNLMGEYFIRYLPVEILWEDILLIAFTTLIVCAVSTLYPAARAAASRPVEALQHDT